MIKEGVQENMGKNKNKNSQGRDPSTQKETARVMTQGPLKKTAWEKPKYR